jgi:hypothetical protein
MLRRSCEFSRWTLKGPLQLTISSSSQRLSDDGACTRMNRLSGNLPAARKTEKQYRRGHVLKLRDPMEQILQRTARGEAVERLRVAQRPRHRGRGDTWRDRIDVDVIEAELSRGAAPATEDALRGKPWYQHGTPTGKLRMRNK